MRWKGAVLVVVTLLAAGAGFGVGRMTNGTGTAKAGTAVPNSGTPSQHDGEPLHRGDAGGVSRTRAPRLRQGEGLMVRLSLKQWRMIQDEPGLLTIHLGQCLKGKRKIEVPLGGKDDFGIVGVMLEWVEGGPDLTKAAEFFGWDETRAEKLEACIMRYAAGLRDVEQKNEQADYLGGGKMVFRFPGTEDGKQQMLERLRNEISEAIGWRDADRLWEFSGMENMWGRTEIRASVSISDGYVSVKLADDGEVIFPLKNAPKGMFTKVVEHHVGEWGRVSHLEHQIDWDRLLEEAIANRTE